MILGNTHVQGIFVYQGDVEYEKGDFVVSGSSIYICTAGNPNTDNNTVLGIDPSSDSENYTIYLGDSLKNINEYFSYISNSGTEVKDDKLITASLLSQILNSYMLGFDEKGIVSEYILQESSGISVSKGLQGFLEGSEEETVLDKILKTEELNNAAIKVSRDLEEIKHLFPVSCQAGYNISYWTEGGSIYISEKEGENTVVLSDGKDDTRGTELIFELIDPEEGTFKVKNYYSGRYLYNNGNYLEWKGSTAGKNTKRRDIDLGDTFKLVSPPSREISSDDNDTYRGSFYIMSMADNKYLSIKSTSVPTRSVIDSATLELVTEDAITWDLSSINGVLRFSSEQSLEDIIREEDLKYLLLRQYTYVGGGNGLCRLQELIDPIRGLTAYRYSRQVGEGLEWEITEWKTDYDPDFVLSVNKLELSYRQAIEDLNKEKENLKNYFRFKELSIHKTTGSITLQCDNPEGEYYIPVEDFKSRSCVITVITQLRNTNTTITVDILDSFMAVSNIMTYYLTDTSSLTIEPVMDEDNKELYGKQVVVRVNNGNLVNIYYRENYTGI